MSSRIPFRTAVAVFAATLTVAYCKKEDAPKEEPLIGKVTFKAGDVMLNGGDIGIGTVVNQGDTIKTGKKSMAVVQFGTGALITVKNETEFKVEGLSRGANGKPSVELMQKKGFSFSKIKPGSTEFKLKSPTSVAGVRGTAFSLQVAKNGSAVLKLIEGKVAATPIDKKTGEEITAKATTVEPGQKLTTGVKGDAKIVDLKPKEEAELKSLNKIEFVAKEKMTEPTAKIEAKEVISAAVKKEVAPEIKDNGAGGKEDKAEAPKPMTLDDLKAKYGKLSVVETKGGQTYTGAFQQKGSQMEIITVNGKVLIPANEVAKIYEKK